MSQVTYARTEDLALGDLRPFPGNARRGDPAVILQTLVRTGQFRSLIARDTGDGLVVRAGNHTLQALLAQRPPGPPRPRPRLHPLQQHPAVSPAHGRTYLPPVAGRARRACHPTGSASAGAPGRGQLWRIKIDIAQRAARRLAKRRRGLPMNLQSVVPAGCVLRAEWQQLGQGDLGSQESPRSVHHPLRAGDLNEPRYWQP